MKRMVWAIICCALISALMIPVASASEMSDDAEVIYFEDGTYLRIVIIESQTRAAGTEAGQKYYDYYSSEGTLLWRVILKAQFSYDGTSSECISASSVVLIENDEWYTISKTASKSGNTATGKVTMGRKMLGVKVDERSVTLSLTCDKNGNLS